MTSIRFIPVGIVIALTASTGQSETSYTTAEVIESRPIYQVVEISVPQEQCWEEEVAAQRYPPAHQSRTPLLISTIIGGAIGNALGHNKSNKQVGAVVGAVLGHSVGRDIMAQRSQSNTTGYETVQRCETVDQLREEERLMGYQVTYLYQGDEYSVRTDSDPGDEIQLQISVEVVL